MTDPIGTAQERELIERARLEAKRESEVSRMMARSKSLRQAGHEPPRDDLYMWSKPEETNTWKLADSLQSRIAEVGRLEERVRVLTKAAEHGLEYIIEAANEYGKKDAVFDNMMRDLKRVESALSLQRRV